MIAKPVGFSGTKHFTLEPGQRHRIITSQRMDDVGSKQGHRFMKDLIDRQHRRIDRTVENLPTVDRSNRYVAWNNDETGPKTTVNNSVAPCMNPGQQPSSTQLQ